MVASAITAIPSIYNTVSNVSTTASGVEEFIASPDVLPIGTFLR